MVNHPIHIEQVALDRQRERLAAAEDFRRARIARAARRRLAMLSPQRRRVPAPRCASGTRSAPGQA